jgi:hypothetical protein
MQAGKRRDLMPGQRKRILTAGAVQITLLGAALPDIRRRKPQGYLIEADRSDDRPRGGDYP